MGSGEKACVGEEGGEIEGTQEYLHMNQTEGRMMSIHTVATERIVVWSVSLLRKGKFLISKVIHRITEAEDRISEVEDRMVEISETERKKEK